MVSVIIPARNEIYLQRTIDDILEKAKGEIEVIATLDGYWPVPILKDDKRLHLIHMGESYGMRHAINRAARLAKGKYLMKIDGHCMLDQGFDIILANDCQPDWMITPSRYSLDAENWKRGRGPIDYLFITYPYIKEDQFGYGMHGKKWLLRENDMGKDSYYGLENQRKEVMIDDIMSFQGSCWFMERNFFFNVIGELDETWYNMYQEAQEILCKTWLSGGRCVVDKNTWYAHWHKNTYGYGLSKKAKLKCEEDSVEYWMNNKWPGQKRPFEWLIDKFWPVPTWPNDWKTNTKWREEWMQLKK